jgi:hypothetical protein
MPKAIVIREYGGSDVLKVEDVSVESPGPTEILIRQTAIGEKWLGSSKQLFPKDKWSHGGVKAHGNAPES